MSNVHFMSKSNEWYTPYSVFESLNLEFFFTLDPCATKENAKCSSFYTMEDNGLTMDWGENIVFCNPPYGRDISKWVEKCLYSSKKGAIVVMLIPARTDTKYWHDLIFGKAKEIRFIKGRLKFGGSDTNAPFPSAVVVFDGQYDGDTVFKTCSFK